MHKFQICGTMLEEDILMYTHLTLKGANKLQLFLSFDHIKGQKYDLKAVRTTKAATLLKDIIANIEEKAKEEMTLQDKYGSGGGSSNNDSFMELGLRRPQTANPFNILSAPINNNGINNPPRGGKEKERLHMIEALPPIESNRIYIKAIVPPPCTTPKRSSAA